MPSTPNLHIMTLFMPKSIPATSCDFQLPTIPYGDKFPPASHRMPPPPPVNVGPPPAALTKGILCFPGDKYSMSGLKSACEGDLKVPEERETATNPP